MHGCQALQAGLRIRNSFDGETLVIERKTERTANPIVVFDDQDLASCLLGGRYALCWFFQDRASFRIHVERGPVRWKPGMASLAKWTLPLVRELAWKSHRTVT